MQQQIQQVLGQTLAPDPSQIKSAEAALKTFEAQPGFGVELLKVVSLDSVPLEIRQQGAVQFKNLVKYSWEKMDETSGVEQVCVLGDDEKEQIRQHIVELMLNAPDKVRAQISEALTIISEFDFPERWPSLLPSIKDRLESSDLKQLNGVLTTTDSIFKRFRGQYIDNISNELAYCQFIIKPLLHVATKLTGACLELGQASSLPDTANLTLSNARLVLSVFYSLNSPGLTDEFEENLKEWMDCIHKLLTLQVPALTMSDPDEESPLDALKSVACECLSLFMEMNEEEFAQYLETFVGDVWKQLVDVGDGVGQDALAMSAIAFLTTVARSVHYSLFAGEDILKQVCEGVVIPNIRLREGDVELFEMNWVEYVRRDTEGSDSDTRRRSASELVKALVEKFPNETTQLFTGYVSALLSEAASDPTNKWQAKDAAIYLVTALAAKTKTSAAGATTTNELVNLNEFYASHIAPELEDKNVEHRTVIKADSLRFVTVFRSQLSRDILLSMFPKCINLLSSPDNVVHSYAATLIERLLAMKSDGKSVFRTADLESLLQPILEKLFGALKMPDSGENEYVMRAIMRFVAFVGTAVGPVTSAALSELSSVLGAVARNPTQPSFNHYLFESIAALVKYGCDGSEASCSSVESVIFPPFQIILQEDVQEFHPYVFQIFSEMIEKRGVGGQNIPDTYMQLLQPLLTPHFWERHGNIPALGRLLRAYIRTCPKQIEPHVQGILGVFQKLVALKSQDHEGMYILDYLLASMDPSTMQQYLGAIWSIIYQRLQSAKTLKFCKSFMYTGALFAALRGGDIAGQSMDSVQPGILLMIVQNVWSPALAAPGAITSEKIALVGSTRLLTESPLLQGSNANAAAASLLQAIAARIAGGTHAPVQSLEDGGQDVEEFSGYSAAYAKLHYASTEEKDWLSNVPDGKVDVAQRLLQYNSQSSGRLAALAAQLPEDKQAPVAQLFKNIGLQ
ncbi:hypothetical protein M9434_006876 [Picochlorum sp. BPE23]|nr:hypothetical protein M9434_006876 [Picochlorum sp. BPE23]